MTTAPCAALFFAAAVICPTTARAAFTQQAGAVRTFDTDQDGLPDWQDDCPRLSYTPGFDFGACDPMDLDPRNDAQPECKARERVADAMLHGGAFTTRIAFSVVLDGELHFADAFRYLGGGAFERDPDGARRLYRIGSTTKPVIAVAAKVLEESGVLDLDDFVDDEDGSREFGGRRSLRQLLSHQGAFKRDDGAIHLYCYPGDILSFWAEPNDLISPHYDSAVYGNLGGGYEYSAFNYSLAGAHLVQRSGAPLAEVLQALVFDACGMCTASLDADRAVRTSIGQGYGVSQTGVMHVGPYINLVSPGDPLCEDNFYSSDDLYGDSYTWQAYHLDETDGAARDPAGGVLASVLDMGHFAEALLSSYHGTGGLISPQGIRELWTPTHDFGCGSGCPYAPYYGTGFFTDGIAGGLVAQCEHGGSRAGYASAFVLRPESNSAVSILANSDLSTVTLSNLAKTILEDFER